MTPKANKKGARPKKGAAASVPRGYPLHRSGRGGKLRSMGKTVGAHASVLVGDEVELAQSNIASVEEAAEELLQKADPLDVKRLCERYGLRREDLGRMTGFSLRALAEWSAGKLPSEPAKRRLHEIRRLLDSLSEVVKPEAIAPWLRERNPAFSNMTPIQVIEVGEINRLWQMVYHMSSDTAE